MSEVRNFFCLIGLLVLAAALYWSGLSGPFTLDDMPNLEPMAYFGGVVDWPSLLYFIGSNESGPIGRPLSMASFLLNDHAWPSDADGFKYANLMIHLLNGLLVYWFSLLVSEHLLNDAERNGRFALIVAALWIVHPIHVSTTLYVVQRMTLLSSTAILSGLIVYLKLRIGNGGFGQQARLLLTLGIIGVVGLLFKETAALLVVYLFVLEVLFFKGNVAVDRWGIVTAAIYILFVLFLAGLAVVAVTSDEAWAQKGFSWSQRLWSQAGILFEYLERLVLPKSQGGGVFQDGRTFDVTLGFATFIPVFVWCGLLLAVCVSAPVWMRYAFFFFLGGHLLESTVVPLELYFEHRNYLPSIGVFSLIAYLFLKCRQWLGNVLLVGVVALFSIVTVNSVAVWSDKDLMRELWALEHPNSIRAQQNLIGHLVDSGELDAAAERMASLNMKRPDLHQLNLQSIIMSCLLAQDIDVENYARIFSRGDRSNGVYDGLLVLRRIISEGNCPQLNFDDLKAWVVVFLEHPGYQDKNMRAFLFQELAIYRARAGDLDGAISMLNKAHDSDPDNIMYSLSQAYWLADAGLYKDAKGFILRARERVSKNPLKKPMQEKLINKAEREISALQEGEN